MAPDPTPADPVAAALAAIREREQAATPGPWKLETDHDDTEGGAPFPYGFRLAEPRIERWDGKYRDYDYLYTDMSDLTMGAAEFIAHARSDVPRLLAAVEAVLKVADDLEQNVCNCGGSQCAPRGATALACAARLREAISRALLGEEMSRG